MSITNAIITHDPIVERFLPPLRPVIGADYAPYRNHIYRVLTYAMHFLGEQAQGDGRGREHIAFALVFHDVGMWTDHDLAYLEPSERVAERVRSAEAPHLDQRLIADIIHWHHKVTPFAGPDAHIVNSARKADWIDATQGKLRKGVAAADIAAVEAAIPVLGFPDVLMRLAADLNGDKKVGGLMRVVRHVYKV